MARVEWNGNLGSVAVSAATDEILTRIAEEIAQDAKRFAPVDTGFLRSSIQATPAENGKATVRAGAPYAGFVEMGTSRMRARPYLRPAAWKRRD